MLKLRLESAKIRQLSSIPHRSSAGGQLKTNRGCSTVFNAAASPTAVQSEGAKYRLLLERARDCTYRHPSGQLHGRMGRRSVLEDGERMLHRCLDQRPICVDARMLLMDNLMAQGRGREAEVPHMVLDALRRTELRSCKRSSRHAEKALTMIRMGFAVLSKVHRESSSTRFTTDVLKLVPDLEGSVYDMAHTKRTLTVRQGVVDFNGSRDED